MPGLLGISNGVYGLEGGPVDGDLSGAVQTGIWKIAGLKPVTDAKVWAFLGDGGNDEPESLGAINGWFARKAGQPDFRDQLQLAALDGPVRATGRLFQELESAFRGARWKRHQSFVGQRVDPILERDTEGLLVKRMGEMWTANTRSCGFKRRLCAASFSLGSDPRLLKLVEPLPDDTLRRLRLGGHDPRKVDAAYKGGGGLQGRADGDSGRARLKDMGWARRRERKKRHAPAEKIERGRAAGVPFALWDSDGDEENCKSAFTAPAEDSEEVRYLRARREALGGYVPERKARAVALSGGHNGTVQRNFWRAAKGAKFRRRWRSWHAAQDA